jgi:hypothetical protein
VAGLGREDERGMGGCGMTQNEVDGCLWWSGFLIGLAVGLLFAVFVLY